MDVRTALLTRASPGKLVEPTPDAAQHTQLLEAAVQNLWTQAQALGFGMMWKTGPAAYSPRVKTALGFAIDDTIVGILHLGTPAVAGTARAPDLSTVVRYL